MFDKDVQKLFKFAKRKKKKKKKKKILHLLQFYLKHINFPLRFNLEEAMSSNICNFRGL